MRSTAKEFKAFLLRGNVVDLAVGVVIGSAFTAVVTSLVQNILTPLIAIPGSADFSTLKFTINGSPFMYGNFINAVISFVLVSAAVFFFVVKPVNKLMSLRKSGVDHETRNKDCPECLSSIPKAAKRCAFCTAELPAGA